MPQPYGRGAIAFAIIIAIIVFTFVLLLSRYGQNSPAPVQAPLHDQR